MKAALAWTGRPAEATLRVVLHERVKRGAPRIRRLLPSSATPGDNVFIEGENLAGADLRAEFGPATTWAVPLDDRTAFCIVPFAAAGPVTVSRFGLRSNAVAFGHGWGDDPTRVLRVDPADGLTGVFRDTPVLVRLSRPVDAATVGPETFRVDEAGGRVSGHARLSPDGCVLIWKGDRLLEAGVEHVLTVSGVRDVRGCDVTPHRSRFSPCTLIRAELPA
jgi:hypothetical protein